MTIDKSDNIIEYLL